MPAMPGPGRSSGPSTPPAGSGSVELLPASAFDLATLTEIYNRARVDYLVPMPMNPGKMRDYLQVYDVDLERSRVAWDPAADRPLGLAMLGLRDDQAWITRVGVMPEARQAGAGRSMVVALLDDARSAGCRLGVIEVIRENWPARRLFGRLGFEPSRELLVTRRPPKPLDIVDHGAVIEVLGNHEALALLEGRSDQPSWATATRSMANAGNIAALRARWGDGSSGWLAYASSAWSLSRIVIETERGDPDRVGSGLLQQLHWRYPLQDAVCENVSPHDPHWPAMQALGYLVSFVRVEMLLRLA